MQFKSPILVAFWSRFLPEKCSPDIWFEKQSIQWFAAMKGNKLISSRSGSQRIDALLQPGKVRNHGIPRRGIFEEHGPHGAIVTA